MALAADIRRGFFAAASAALAAGVANELVSGAPAAEGVLSPAGVAAVFAAAALGVLAAAVDVFAAGVFCGLGADLGAFAREAFADLVVVLGVLAAAFLGVLVAVLGVFAAVAADALGVLAAFAGILAARASGGVSVVFGVFAKLFGVSVRVAGLGVFARGVLVAGVSIFAAVALADLGVFAAGRLEAEATNFRLVLAADAVLSAALASGTPAGKRLATLFRMRPIAPLGWATSCEIFSVALLPSFALSGWPPGRDAMLGLGGAAVLETSVWLSCSGEGAGDMYDRPPSGVRA